MPQWPPYLLAGLRDLRNLTLIGRPFQDARAIAEIIQASPQLRTLRLCLTGTEFHSWRHPSNVEPHTVVEAEKLWAYILAHISSAGPDRVRRAGEPYLRLEELAIDDFAAADFASLTDLNCLRHLTLLNHEDPHYGVPWPSATSLFRAAVGLRSIAVADIGRDVTDLVARLRLVNPLAFTHLSTTTLNRQRLKVLSDGSRGEGLACAFGIR